MIDRTATRLLVATFLMMLMGNLARASDATTISGAGATFPYPVYSKWADTYAK